MKRWEAVTAAVARWRAGAPRRQLSVRERWLAVAAACLVIGSAIVVGVAAPVCRQWRSLETQIAQDDARLRQAEEVLARREPIASTAHAYQDAIMTSADAEAVMDQLLRQVHAAAQDTSFVVTQLRPRPPRRQGEHVTCALDVQGTASWEQLRQFLADVQQRVLLAQVSSLQMSAEAPDRWRALLVVECLRFASE